MRQHRSLGIALAIGAMLIAAICAPSMAAAAGKPEVKSVSSSHKSINELDIKSSIYPNGAATTYQFEYGTTMALGSSTATKSAGEKSEWAEYAGILLGLKPFTTYYFRLSATNKFGTTVSSISSSQTSHWLDFDKVKEVTFPETYASQGTFIVEWPDLGGKPTIVCTEKGYGTIGNAGGVGDIINMELTNCTNQGEEKCTVSPTTVTMDGSFANAFLSLTGGTGECKFFNGEISIPPFSLHVEATGSPYKFWGESETQAGKNRVVILFGTAYSLTGASTGGKFGWG